MQVWLLGSREVSLVNWGIARVLRPRILCVSEGVTMTIRTTAAALSFATLVASKGLDYKVVMLSLRGEEPVSLRVIGGKR